MKLHAAIELFETHGSQCMCAECKNTKMEATAAGGQAGGSSMTRDFAVTSTKFGLSPGKYGNYDDRVVSRHRTKEDAENASLAMPGTKVTTQPLPEETQEVRDMARKRLVKTNPDVS